MKLHAAVHRGDWGTQHIVTRGVNPLSLGKTLDENDIFDINSRYKLFYVSNLKLISVCDEKAIALSNFLL